MRRIEAASAMTVRMEIGVSGIRNIGSSLSADTLASNARTLDHFRGTNGSSRHSRFHRDDQPYLWTGVVPRGFLGVVTAAIKTSISARYCSWS